MKTINLLAALLALSFAVDASEQAPSCPVKTLDGKRSLDLADGQGKVRYVDFWASWCGPCADSFPFLNQLHGELAGRGVEIIGVNLDENHDDAVAFLEKTPAQFTIVEDKQAQCPARFGVKAMPSSYLIDRHGQIRHVHLGFNEVDKDELRAKVQALLDEK